MKYEDWERDVPKVMTGDPIWKMVAYRLSMFLADVAWHDVTKLSRDSRTHAVADQLRRSIGSIRANMSEGYAYSTGGNRAKYFEYALGSARESKEWYYDGRQVLGDKVFQHRAGYLVRVVALLTSSISTQRRINLREPREPHDQHEMHAVHEPRADYIVNSLDVQATNDIFETIPDDLLPLLQNVPLP